MAGTNVQFVGTHTGTYRLQHISLFHCTFSRVPAAYSIFKQLLAGTSGRSSRPNMETVCANSTIFTYLIYIYIIIIIIIIIIIVIIIIIIIIIYIYIIFI